jgi:dimeric dUTPase (all-alpha-NTP-PPase superfamily)
MTSKDIDLIKEMLQMQAKLDEAIMKEYGLTEIDKKNLSFAILDEVGELTHELKGDWCWWKKSQAPVDEEKVLGELVDIWHFVLSYQNHFDNGEEELRAEEQMIDNAITYFCEIKVFKTGIIYLLADLTSINSNKLERLIAITEYLGFSVEDVYKAYCKKNKVNYQRLESGY